MESNEGNFKGFKERNDPVCVVKGYFSQQGKGGKRKETKVVNGKNT